MEKNTEKDIAIANIKDFLKEDSNIYAICTHVSSRGMSRAISFMIPYYDENIKELRIIYLDKFISDILDLPIKHNGVWVTGVGMDMGYYIVDQLNKTLGFKCRSH